MRGEENGFPVVRTERDQQRSDAFRVLGVQVPGGFIAENYHRIVGQRNSNGGTQPARIKPAGFLNFELECANRWA